MEFDTGMFINFEKCMMLVSSSIACWDSYRYVRTLRRGKESKSAGMRLAKFLPGKALKICYNHHDKIGLCWYYKLLLLSNFKLWLFHNIVIEAIFIWHGNQFVITLKKVSVKSLMIYFLMYKSGLTCMNGTMVCRVEAWVKRLIDVQGVKTEFWINR